MIKTYAIRGLMECQALIPAGRSAIRIPFAGGSMSGYGITPATYRTADRALQHLIENSPDFRRGRITVERVEGTPEAQKAECAPRAGETVEFDDLQQAREYLADSCGVDRRRLRTAPGVTEAAREHGVTIKGF